MEVINIPTDPLRRTGWVLAELKVRGLSFRKLAAQHGLSQTTLSLAMRTPSYRAEQIIAKAIGVDPVALFRERYDAEGRRLHNVRKRSEKRHPRQRSKEEAA